MGADADDDRRSIAALRERLGTNDVVLVDAFNEAVARVVETTPELDHEFVVGDVSDYGVSANGHAHFDLVAGDAAVHCVVFGSRRDGVDADLADGTRVAVSGDRSYYVERGSVSLLVDDVVDLGEGQYHRTYREYRTVLEEEGLLDDAAKRDLPDRPTTVGVATSAESAAREDAVTSIHDRFPSVDVVVRDTTVQGSEALLSLMDAVAALDDDPDVDVILVTRGGGADKHLRVFDEPPLCRVLANAETPVVVAVGHETDRTLAGDVADERVMTPTEAGRIVPDRERLDEARADLAEDLRRAYRETATDALATSATALETAYDRTASDDLAVLASDLAAAYERRVREDLRSYRDRVESAYDDLERDTELDRERARREAAFERRQRRQRAIIALLVALLLATLAYVVLL